MREAGVYTLGGELRAHFGDIDIYLFDQLHRGWLSPGMRVLDAGCGRGRNLEYLLRTGFDVQAVDSSADAIARRDLRAIGHRSRNRKRFSKARVARPESSKGAVSNVRANHAHRRASGRATQLKRAAAELHLVAVAERRVNDVR